MSEPVVVQGTTVASPYDHGTTSAAVQSGAAPSGDFTKGSKQEVRCRDPFFALLLWGNVGAICGVVAAYGTAAFEKVFGDQNSSVDWAPYLYAAAVTGIFSLILAAIMFLVMMKIPKFMIKTSLIFVVILSGVWCVIAFIGGNMIGGIIGAVFFLLMMCYARAVWSRIPFATVRASWPPLHASKNYFLRATNPQLTPPFAVVSLLIGSVSNRNRKISSPP